MQYFAYPALFFEDEGIINVRFPDLDISTQGDNFTEAFLFAKDLLRVYFCYVLKYDLDFNLPSKVEDLIKTCKKGEIAMIVDAMVGPKDIKTLSKKV